MTLVATLVAALLQAGLAAAPSPVRMVFVPDGAGPTLVVDVAVPEQGAAGTRRRAEVVVLTGDLGQSRAFTDVVQALPIGAPARFAAPPAVALAPGPGDLVLVTLADIGEWQSPGLSPLTARDRALGPPVASKTAARLLLGGGRSLLFGPAGSGAGEDPAPATVAASLYGTEVLVNGRAYVTLGTPPLAVLAPQRGALSAVGLNGFVVDVQAGCGRVIPSRLLGPAEPARAQLRVGTPVCLTHGGVAARIEGARLGVRGDEPLTGVLVALPSALLPSGPLPSGPLPSALLPSGPLPSGAGQ